MLDFLGKLFGSGPLLETAQATRQFECFAWLLRNTGGFARFRHAVLVRPTDDYFRRDGRSGHDLAEAIFSQVRQYAGMAQWPCRLQAQEPEPNRRVGPTLIVQGMRSPPVGTFRKRGHNVVITYDPRAVVDPVSLIAMFAHELGHYLIHKFRDAPPGGDDCREFAADLASVFLGFGIFSANASFDFSQFRTVDTQGWRVRRQGYLSEAELVHALAIFTTLLGLPKDFASPHLDAHLRDWYETALTEILASPTFA